MLNDIDSKAMEEEQDPTERLLSSPGQLAMPEKFKKWFPAQHGHRDIRRLFVWHKELGHGVTGSVHEIVYKSKVCAVKQIERNDQWARMLFTSEARVLSKVRHQGIISFVDMFFDEKYYYLVLEKADFDLYAVMKRNGRLSERETRNITYALLKALAYMHRKNVAHRGHPYLISVLSVIFAFAFEPSSDLKPENIVFKREAMDQPLLIDFGDAEMAKTDKTYTELIPI